MKRKASTAQKPALKRQRTAGSFALQKAVLRSKTDELKNIDVLTASTITFNQTTANLALLNGIDDGATASTRVGRKVILTSFSWRWRGSFATTTTGSSGLRCLIVYDKQTNAAAPAATDVLVQDNIQSQMNLANSKRFKVLADVLVPCVGTAGPQSWNMKGYVQLEKPTKNKPGLEMIFNNASTANVDSIITGSVYALFYQDGGILTASPSSAFYSRFRFVDA